MKPQGEPCDRKGQARFEAEGSGVIQTFTLHGVHPVVVAESGGSIVSFAATFPYSNRECYSGIAEFSVYVKREMRGIGAGKAVMRLLIEESGRSGFHKLVSRVFPENRPSRSLLGSLGFREVGIYEKHARLDGKWRDAVIVEYLIRENIV
ncbi:MAG: GNAT family N-acetyltransferase [Thermoplasmataceae archaeon]